MGLWCGESEKDAFLLSLKGEKRKKSSINLQIWFNPLKPEIKGRGRERVLCELFEYFGFENYSWTKSIEAASC